MWYPSIKAFGGEKGGGGKRGGGSVWKFKEVLCSLGVKTNHASSVCTSYCMCVYEVYHHEREEVGMGGFLLLVPLFFGGFFCG